MKAFPTDQFFVTPHGTLDRVKSVQEGMDLRDYFAAKAIHIVYQLCYECEDGFHASDVANMCYSVADAMMEARKQ